MALDDELDRAYAGQVADLFNVYFDSVAAAKDKDAALAEGGRQFQRGLALLNRVRAKARELLTASPSA